MMRTVVIFALAIALIFVADRLVRIENQRYALYLRMCDTPANVPRGITPEILEARWRCLENVQTRTSWFWHLGYGLTQSVPAVPLLHP
jgi:hypothetical protein